jgi:hypothetical protein
MTSFKNIRHSQEEVQLHGHVGGGNSNVHAAMELVVIDMEKFGGCKYLSLIPSYFFFIDNSDFTCNISFVLFSLLLRKNCDLSRPQISQVASNINEYKD